MAQVESDNGRGATVTIVDSTPRRVIMLPQTVVEPPKPKRTSPKVAAGVAVGASAMYLRR
jgi:hypothetical protein